MLWLILAFTAALATSLTAIFAKVGIKQVNSDFATFYRTGIVILFTAVLCFIDNSFSAFCDLSLSNWLFLTVSGLCTGVSWLCYYKALKLGDVNKVAPIDKSGFVLTTLLFICFFFNDTTNGGNLLTIAMLILSMALMLVGSILMIGKKETDGNKKESRAWLVYAVLSALFASLVSLFVKIGLKNTDTQLGTLIRTVIVFIFSGIIAFSRGELKGFSSVSKKTYFFLTLSGIATGIAWLCEYAGLNTEGVSPVVVNSITKLAILFTMLFSFIFLKEKFTKRSLIGLGLLTVGIVVVIIFSL